MLPEFDDSGHLPDGIHQGTLEEVAARFGGGSSERQAGTEELREFVGWAREAGILRLVVGGSYVTAKAAPNDVDAVILPGPEYPRRQQLAEDCGWRWPLLHVQVAADETDFREWAEVDFGMNRTWSRRGVVEILL